MFTHVYYEQKQGTTAEIPHHSAKENVVRRQTSSCLQKTDILMRKVVDTHTCARTHTHTNSGTENQG
jgi:hypothetical protein